MPQKDPEARRAYMREWHKKNRDKVRANQRRYLEQNREKERERLRRYYQENRERVLEKTREHQKSPEYRRKKSEAARKWAKEHPDRVRANQRRNWAKKKYGLTLEEYDTILARGCAICGTHAGRVVGRRGKLKGTVGPRLCIDHDHISGKVRDALCHSCNTGLGSFGDDPIRLKAAAKYLEKHRRR